MSAPFFSIQVSVGIPDSCEVVAFDRKQARYTVARPTNQDGDGAWSADYGDVSRIACAINDAITFTSGCFGDDDSQSVIDQIFFESFWLGKHRLKHCLESNSAGLDETELRGILESVAGGFLSGEMGDNDVNVEEVSGVVGRFAEELWAIRDRLDGERLALGKQEEDAE